MVPVGVIAMDYIIEHVFHLRIVCVRRISQVYFVMRSTCSWSGVLVNAVYKERTVSPSYPVHLEQ